MEVFKTYIFEQKKNRSRKQLFYNLVVLGAVSAIIYMCLIGVLGVGFGIIGSISLIVAILKAKIDDDKYMGITAYGVRKEKLAIAEEYLEISDAKIPFAEVNDLVIYVDEYAGMPRDIYGVHHGGNNEITFRHKGNKFSINYIIKNKSDFKKVEKLVEKIERNQLPKST
ncbi:MAG: hypothetical protein RIC35_14210 [Marinoscillum sp.]